MPPPQTHNHHCCRSFGFFRFCCLLIFIKSTMIHGGALAVDFAAAVAVAVTVVVVVVVVVVVPFSCFLI